jgi:chromosome partitioning protein
LPAGKPEKAAKTMLTLQELGTLTGLSQEQLVKSVGRETLARMPGGRLGVPPVTARQLLTKRGYKFAPRTVAFVNLKGGVGKTTCAVTTAARSTQYGFKTCVVDLDPQASATLAFDRVPSADAPLFCDVWAAPDDLTEHALVPVLPNLALLPSALENGLLETALSDPQAQLIAVRGVCKALVQQGFDLVLVDCPPTLGTATISAVCAADVVVIPLGCDPYSLNALELTTQEIQAICRNYKMDEPQVLILVSRFDRREKAAREIFETLVDEHPEHLVREPIRVSTEFNKALATRQTIFANNRSSPVKLEYDHFVRRLLNINFTAHLEQGI